MADDGDLTPVLSAMDHTWGSILALAESLRPEEFELPTRCPGWDVHDQFAHIASLESWLAGGEIPPEAPPAPYVRNPVGERMERGVHAMRGWPPDQVIEALRVAIEARRLVLQSNPPRAGDTVIGVMGNPIPAERSLPIRVFDLWVHEQDVRVATGRLGNEAGPGAEVGRSCIVGMLPGYWVEEAEAGPGQAFTLRVTGALPFECTVIGAADGSATYADEQGALDPVAVVELDWMDLVARTNGRDGAEETPVRITGDQAMAAAMVEALPMSP